MYRPYVAVRGNRVCGRRPPLIISCPILYTSLKAFTNILFRAAEAVITPAKANMLVTMVTANWAEALGGQEGGLEAAGKMELW